VRELGQLSRIPGEDSKEKEIFEFQGFPKFGKTWKNSTRRFRRNFEVGISPKFF
jgi:hypothetical protein